VHCWECTTGAGDECCPYLVTGPYILAGELRVAAGTLFTIYLVGVGLIWVCAIVAVRAEPTTHGQSILIPMGCALGIFWPLALAYMLFFGLPMLALAYLRGELD
jgi:uncharacterized oligopeptide transporter (OPT) family protein